MKRDQRRNERVMAIWLLACCAVLLALILLGGATRLTGSGLSIVDWRPVTGVVPPLSEQAWDREFQMYRQSPEYQKVNRGMSLPEFKVIFWYEWAHRVLARGLGLMFVLPLAWFWWRGYLTRKLRLLLVGLLLLGALQGYMGWFMVQSGLVDIPRVSPYRLAAHLGLALIIYAAMFRIALSLLWPASSPPRPRSLLQMNRLLLVMAGTTIISGAFVAGLKAGLVYNTFPLMAGRWVPEGLLYLEPAWRNFFENPATVQFTHRVLGLSTLAAVLAAWGCSRLGSNHRRGRRVLDAVLAVALVQVGLGIATLLQFVPTGLAIFHQAGAVILLSAILVADHQLRREPATNESEVLPEPDPAPG